ncbi:MAG: M14 family zinc carboxypeptidase, partial [Planctomycetota bacterium]
MPDPQRSLVEIKRGEISLPELWTLGGDDLGVDDDRLYVLLSAPALDELKARGVEYRIVYDDIYEAYRAYRKNLRILRSEPFTDYHDVDSVVAAMQDIATQHAEIAALEVIGYSIEGRPIHALRISDDAPVVDPEEPGMVILGCHHGREWISVEVPLFFAQHLAENYLRDGDVTRL